MNDTIYTWWCTLALMGIVIAPQLRGADKPKLLSKPMITMEMVRKKAEKLVISRVATFDQTFTEVGIASTQSEKIRQRMALSAQYHSNLENQEEARYYRRYLIPWAIIVGTSPSIEVDNLDMNFFAVGLVTLYHKASIFQKEGSAFRALVQRTKKFTSQEIAQALDTLEVINARKETPDIDALGFLHLCATITLDTPGASQYYHEFGLALPQKKADQKSKKK